MWKITSWNVNSLNMRLAHVKKYLQEVAPDYLLVQEIKQTEDKFPHMDFQELGYSAYAKGQKAYNGVAIISKNKLSIETDSLYEDEQARFMHAYDNVRNLHILNCYMPNGSPVFNDDGSEHEKYKYKLTWMKHLVEYIKQLRKQRANIIVAGDWNIAPFDIDAYDAQKMRASSLLQDSARQLFFTIKWLGMYDIFELFSQKSNDMENRYTWWDYRANSFGQNNGLRIDHILASPNLTNYYENCDINVEYRGLESPSDHAPICASFGDT